MSSTFEIAHTLERTELKVGNIVTIWCENGKKYRVRLTEIRNQSNQATNIHTFEFEGELVRGLYQNRAARLVKGIISTLPSASPIGSITIG